MFDHISLGIANLEKSIVFYDAALKSLGINRMFASPDAGIVGYSGLGGAW